jgi:EpsI family protein
MPDLAALVPQRVGRWQAAETDDLVLPPEDMLSRAVYDSYLARGFTAGPGPRIMLLVAYGAVQSYALQLHRPELCYPASGFELSDRRELTPAAGPPASFLVAKRGRTEEAVLFWTRIGNAFPQSTWDQRLAIVRAVLSGAAADGVLVRLSIRDVPPAAALAALSSFTAQFRTALNPAGRELLFGRSPSASPERAND